MFRHQALLYLPITGDSLELVLKSDEAMGVLSDIGNSGLCSLVALQSLADVGSDRDALTALEKKLADTFEIANELSEVDFVAVVAAGLDLGKLSQSAERLPDLAVGLMTASEVAAGAYLTRTGRWSFEFSAKHATALASELISLPTSSSPARAPQFLSPEQARVLWPLRQQLDEPMEINAYAGTGKTFVTEVLLDQYRQAGVSFDQLLVLTQRDVQRKAVQQRSGSIATFRTFGEQVSSLLVAGSIPIAYSDRGKGFNYRLIAEAFGIRPIGCLPPFNIVRYARMTLRRWCESADPSIEECHLPFFFDGDRVLTSPELANMAPDVLAVAKASVLDLASKLWDMTTDPNQNELGLPRHAYHRTKLAAVNELQIPSRYKYIVVDEAHDLTPAMMQIIDRSDGICVTLRDDYQNIDTLLTPPRVRASQKAMNHSMRSGTKLEALVNPLIATHPLGMRDVYAGNVSMRFDLRTYPKAFIPPKPTTLLVTDEWGLWEWTHRLSREGLSFFLLGNMKSLNEFVSDCIRLFNHGRRPWHHALANYQTWEDIRQSLGTNASFIRIERLLERGISLSDWAAIAKTTTCSVTSAGSYGVGRMEDAKSSQFDEVMLAPDVSELVWRYKAKGVHVPRQIASKIYIATTRSRRVLWVPAALRDWLEEISVGRFAWRGFR